MAFIVVIILAIVVAEFWDWLEKTPVEDETKFSEDEIALAELLEKRQEINELFLTAKSELKKISKK